MVGENLDPSSKCLWLSGYFIRAILKFKDLGLKNLQLFPIKLCPIFHVHKISASRRKDRNNIGTETSGAKRQEQNVPTGNGDRNVLLPVFKYSNWWFSVLYHLRLREY